MSPSIDKLQIAIKEMKNIKSPEIDGFLYAVYKNCESFPLTRVFELVILMCENGEISTDFQESIISFVFERKDYKCGCNISKGLPLTCTWGN